MGSQSISAYLCRCVLTLMSQRIDMGANRVSYDRMSSALETLTSGRLSDGGTVLRDLIIGTAYITI